MTEELYRRVGALEIELARHLGQCEERHKDIVRRHEEGRSDRSQLRADMARDVSGVNSKVDRINGKLLSLAITIGGATLAIVAQIVLQATKVIK